MISLIIYPEYPCGIDYIACERASSFAGRSSGGGNYLSDRDREI